MSNKRVPVITLDGPSGTGKGTLCHLLAKHLGWNLLDSGAIYRVLAYAARQEKIEIQDIASLTVLAKSLNLRFTCTENNRTRTLLNEKNVSQAIRTEQCGQDASKVASIPEVREALLTRQRDFAKPPGLVTDGRDMGTVVFPDAFLKVFLFANEGERAHRRYLQLKKKGEHVSLAQVVEELAQRDARDTARAHAPLRPAPDAVMVDTTRLSIVQVFETVLHLVDERL